MRERLDGRKLDPIINVSDCDRNSTSYQFYAKMDIITNIIR